jgi:hypothetical protein
MYKSIITEGCSSCHRPSLTEEQGEFTAHSHPQTLPVVLSGFQPGAVLGLEKHLWFAFGYFRDATQSCTMRTFFLTRNVSKPPLKAARVKAVKGLRAFRSLHSIALAHTVGNPFAEGG